LPVHRTFPYTNQKGKWKVNGADGLRGYAKVVYNVDLSIEEAKRFRSMFFQSYPGIAAWHRSTNSKSASEARTLAGRRRKWQSAAKITELLNTPVQGTSADITKKALGLLPQRLADTGGQIIGTVHDEIILEVPQEMTHDAAVILRETMIEAGKTYLARVPIGVEVTIVETWAEK
jgi:DNA polymerase I-like protein with 3'-5' exonuclease and polymerase domains